MNWKEWGEPSLKDVLFDSNRPASPVNIPQIDLCQATFVGKIITLLREFFPEETKDAANFKFYNILRPPIDELWLQLRKTPKVFLKFSVGKEMTVVMVVVEQPKMRDGVEVEQRSQAREGFQNSDWDSFVGWVSYVATFIQKEIPENGSNAT